MMLSISTRAADLAARIAFETCKTIRACFDGRVSDGIQSTVAWPVSGTLRELSVWDAVLVPVLDAVGGDVHAPWSIPSGRWCDMQPVLPDPERLSPGRHNGTALANELKRRRYFCLLSAASRVPGAYAALCSPVARFVDEVSEQIDARIEAEVTR